MPVTKLDEKGRILLPCDIRKTGELKEGDEFAVDSLGDGIFFLKSFDVEIHLPNRSCAMQYSWRSP